MARREFLFHNHPSKPEGAKDNTIYVITDVGDPYFRDVMKILKERGHHFPGYKNLDAEDPDAFLEPGNCICIYQNTMVMYYRKYDPDKMYIRNTYSSHNFVEHYKYDPYDELFTALDKLANEKDH